MIISHKLLFPKPLGKCRLDKYLYYILKPRKCGGRESDNAQVKYKKVVYNYKKEGTEPGTMAQ